jgi:hypothetical protein
MSETNDRPPAGPDRAAARQLTSLARAELALARARLLQVRGRAWTLGVLGLVLVWLAPVLALGAVIGLARLMPVWAAVLVVAAGVVLFGVGLALAGRSRRRWAGGPVRQRAWPGLRADAADLDRSVPRAGRSDLERSAG